MLSGHQRAVGAILQVEAKIRLRAAAVALIDQIAELVGGVIQGIGAVEEQLNLTNSAHDQAGIDLRPHVAPDAHGAGKLIGGVIAVDKQIGKPVFGLQPRASHVEGEADEGVVLMLRQIQIVCIKERIELLLDLRHDIQEQLVRLFHGNLRGGEAIFIGISCGTAVANGHLRHIVIGNSGKALVFLDKVNSSLTGLKIVDGEIGIRLIVVVGDLFMVHLAIVHRGQRITLYRHGLNGQTQQ